MTEIQITVDQLRELIGLRVRHQGLVCQIIEVLEDGPSIVLQCTGRRTVIQPNQYGEANRRVPETCAVPVLTLDRKGLSAEFLELDLVE